MRKSCNNAIILANKLTSVAKAVRNRNRITCSLHVPQSIINRQILSTEIDKYDKLALKMVHVAY